MKKVLGLVVQLLKPKTGKYLTHCNGKAATGCFLLLVLLTVTFT